MKLFGAFPKCLGKIFNGVSHFACNSRPQNLPNGKLLTCYAFRSLRNYRSVNSPLQSIRLSLLSGVHTLSVCPITCPLYTRYRCAAATRRTISATTFHFFRMTGRFANLAGIFLNDRVEPKSNASSTSCRSCGSRSRTIRVVIIGRVAHPSGPSRRCAVCTPVLRPLCFSHVRAGGKGKRYHDSDRYFCFI